MPTKKRDFANCQPILIRHGGLIQIIRDPRGAGGGSVSPNFTWGRGLAKRGELTVEKVLTEVN